MRPAGLYVGSDLCRHCGRDFLYPVYGWRGWCNDCRGDERGVIAYCTAWIKDVRVQRSPFPRQCRHTIKVAPEDVAFAICVMHRRYGGAPKPKPERRPANRRNTIEGGPGHGLGRD